MELYSGYSPGLAITTIAMTEPGTLKSVLSSIFRRRGGETEKTKLFENLPQQVQEGLCSAISLLPDETIVLALGSV